MKPHEQTDRWSVDGKTNPNLLTVEEVAGRLGVSPSTVYALAKDRKIPHRRIGLGRGRLLFTEGDIDEYLRRTKVEADSLPVGRFRHL